MYENIHNEKLYKIVFDGEIMEGCVLDEVKKRLSGIFKWDQEKVDELFSVTPLEIADHIDYQTAMTYKAPFERAGAVCKIYHSEKGLMTEKDSLSSFVLKHKETGQSRQTEIKTDMEPNIPIPVEGVESKEILNEQKDAFYEYFFNIYGQAKEKTAGKKSKLILYALIGIFFLLAFMIPMIAAMKGQYAIGIAGGLLMAFWAGIIKYPINNKMNKNRSLKTALYFKEHISIEKQKNRSFFLAALILWAQKIPDPDPAKDEMISVTNEVALANTLETDILKKYLKKIGDLDKQTQRELNKKR